MTKSADRPVALITGAAVRVGRAIALELAGAGYDVAVHYRRSADAAAALVAEIATHGRRAHAFAADLLEDGAAERLPRDVLTTFGRLDALVNNAASFIADSPETIDPAVARRQLELNLLVPMLLSCASAEPLAARGGVIINVADARADQPMKGYLSYTSAKAGLVGLTRSLARELAPAVRVNAVAPGAVLFPDHFDAAARERIRARIPAGRIGVPQDVARAVRYLVCDAPFVTGQVLTVDGGRTLV